MANFDLYFPKEIASEGSTYENVPNDNGGGTKFGLTLDDIMEYNIDLNNDGKININDIKDMFKIQAYNILKKLYWDFFRGDEIKNQSLAEFIVDSGLNMGRVLITKYLQSALKVTVDGKLGNQTLNALNTINNSQQIFDSIYNQRKNRYIAIIANNPSQVKFQKGWFNRLNNIKFIA